MAAPAASADPMVRIRVVLRAEEGRRRVLLRVTSPVWQAEVTVGEVRRTAFAAQRCAWRAETYQRLADAGFAAAEAARLVGPGAATRPGEFAVTALSRRRVRLSRPGLDRAMTLTAASAAHLAATWLRCAESAEADVRLLRALRHATALTARQVDDVLAYLRLLRSDDPAAELGG